jgi:hypothetical protein
MGSALFTPQPNKGVRMIIETITTKKNKPKSCICKCDFCGITFRREYTRTINRKRHFCNAKCAGLGYMRDSRYGTKAAITIFDGKKHYRYYQKKENRKGENASNWKGGRKITPRGYVEIYKPEHPNSMVSGYIAEHRLVMANFINRFLEKEEVVHHINGDKTDNRIENLILFANDIEHKKYHREIRKQLIFI